MIETLSAAELVRQIGQLPHLPQAVTEVRLALHRNELSAQRSIELIGHDQALAARTLRLANSAFYGAPGRVGCIGDAVRMLGLRTVSGVLTAAALHGAWAGAACAGFDFKQHWRHAIATALAARSLAPWARQDPDQAFLAGLMHDMGELAVAVIWPGPAAAALQLAHQSACTATAAEAQALGCTHAQVGALLAEHWRFPAATALAIAQHHEEPQAELTQAGTSLAGLLHAADALAHVLDLAGQPQPAGPLWTEGAWTSLGVAEADALRIFSLVESGTRELSEALQLG